MFYRVYCILYNTPIYLIGVYIFVAVFIWTFLAVLFDKKRGWMIVNCVLCFSYIICVVYVTLLSRTPSSREISWLPFQSMFLAIEYSDIYNQIAMNILMFVPLGLTIPFFISVINKRCVRTTIIICILFSLCIELCQFAFGLGRCEIDDIIMNTIGASFGCISYIISNSIIMQIKKR